MKPIEKSLNNLPDKKLIVYFLLMTVEAFYGAISLILIPADLKNQWLLGYSFPRMVMLLFFLFAGIFSLGMLFSMAGKKTFGKRFLLLFFQSAAYKNIFLSIVGFIVLFLLIPILFPAIRFGKWIAQIERLLPLIWFVILVCIQTILLGRYWKTSFQWKDGTSLLKANRVLAYSALLAFGLLLAFWAGIALTGIGVDKNWGLWVEAGVPILSRQIVLILGLLFGLQIFGNFLSKKHFNRSKFILWLAQHKEWLIGIGLWGLTFLLWTQIPIQKNYFFPGPYAPDNQFFPFSDAATWDIVGQSALIGQGFANGYVNMDHLGLSAFLAILHVIFGQVFTTIVNAQILVYSLYPVILYWVGKSFQNRNFGLLLAGLGIVHQINSFKLENVINLSHAKMLMTEFPTGLLVALLTLLLFLWARKPSGKNMGYLLPMGGILAGLLFLRFNMVAMPFAIIAMIGIILFRKWKQTVLAASILMISLLVTLSPWMITSWKATGSPWFFLDKVSFVFDTDFRQSPQVEPTPTAPISFQSPSNNQGMQLISYNAKTVQLPKDNSADVDIRSTGEAILNHFVHNFVTSVLVLPATPYFYDLEQVVVEVNPFWDRSTGPWYGEISVSEGLFIFLNLVIISIGFGIAWKRWRLAGFVPLAIYVAFNFFLALARTSGGRYIVPIVWIVLLYYGLGIYQIALWIIRLFAGKVLFNPETLEVNDFNIKKGLFCLFPFFLFVFTMTMIHHFTPQRYQALSKSDILNKIETEALLTGTDITIDELKLFFESPDSEALFGRNLYPRFYTIDQGEYSSSKTVYAHYNFPRLGFLLIGPFENKSVLLPMKKSPGYFPHAQDTLVIGCTNTTNPLISVDALVVIIVDENGAVSYSRQPEGPLSCPLPWPVCDNNGVCK